MEFQEAIQHIYKFEGGLVDHPKDPGGITKYGISFRAYPEYGREGIRRLTKQEAGKIYYRDYWHATKCEDLPGPLRLIIFDCAVNQGVSYATKALQSAVSVRADGVLGPITMKAIKNADVERTLHKIAMNRYLRYHRNPNWSIFGEGWMSRLLSVSLATNK